MATTKTDDQKDGLALIVGGLFVLALVFAAYNYFNKGSDLDRGIESSTSETEDVRGEKVAEGDLNGEGVSTTREPGRVLREEVPEPEELATWQATDYKEGDIRSGSHEVRAGDTLWEIAEAVYGNGAEWVRILEANQDTIDFLPSGQQALIVPGQTLVIP